MPSSVGLLEKLVKWSLSPSCTASPHAFNSFASCNQLCDPQSDFKSLNAFWVPVMKSFSPWIAQFKHTQSLCSFSLLILNTSRNFVTFKIRFGLLRRSAGFFTWVVVFLTRRYFDFSSTSSLLAIIKKKKTITKMISVLSVEIIFAFHWFFSQRYGILPKLFQSKNESYQT